MTELDEYLEVFRNVEKMAHYLKDSGFDFVITAKPIDPGENQHEFTISCTNKEIES